MATRYPKEQMHRIKYTKLTPEQILGKLSAVNGPTSASPLSDVFAGKSLSIVLDNGPSLKYTFTGNNRLSLTEGNAAAVQTAYGALTLDRIALFSHLIPRTPRGYIVVVDQDTNLATVFETWFSGYQDNREVQRQVYYGYVEQVPLRDGAAPCPLVEMAREQGGGVVRRKERVIFEHVYVKHGGVWKIQRSAHHFEKDAIGPREVS